MDLQPLAAHQKNEGRKRAADEMNEWTGCSGGGRPDKSDSVNGSASVSSALFYLNAASLVFFFFFVQFHVSLGAAT